ncbi:MAG: GGDEF domain-containing protein [Rhodoferax sp.]|nr:GGDEF domain-containing protein [Rhodoferax sp.]
MDSAKLIIWSAMLGGLVTLATISMVDIAMHRSLAAWRGLAFILTTGCSAMLLTGLVDFAFPGFTDAGLLALKTSFAPLSGALALSYLGLWLGAAADDLVVHLCTAWGSAGLLVAAGILAALSLILPLTSAYHLLLMSTLANATGVVLGCTAALRAMALGDRLARGMVLAFVFLAVMLTGLHAENLFPHWPGTTTRIVTAASTVAFFLVVTAITIQRNRLTRKLERLASLSQGADPATGLPRGSMLLSKVDDAFWRSARMQGECTVVCLHIRNLYELGDIAGHQVDQQILVALAARTRRAVGFRSVVGLYHPRCFVVVISNAKQQRTVDTLLLRLRHILAQPLVIVGDSDNQYTFTPRFGMGRVTVDASRADPASVVDQAERLAFAADGGVDAGPDLPEPASQI